LKDQSHFFLIHVLLLNKKRLEMNELRLWMLWHHQLLLEG
jgi:hypothetical protein